MPIQAQSADGAVHEFPDGTPDAIVDKAMKAYAAHTAKTNGVVDTAKSALEGVTKGLTGFAGLPGDIGDLVNRGMSTIGIPTRDTSKAPKFDNGNYVTMPGGEMGLGSTPNSEQTYQNLPGQAYEPKTAAGHIAERFGEFAPAVIGGPAKLGTRLLGRAVAPATGSLLGENLGDENSPSLRAAGQIGGALLGAGAFGGARALSQAVSNAKLTPEEIAQSYAATVAKSAGVEPGTSIPSFGRGQTAAEALGPTGVANLAALGRRGGDTAKALGEHLLLRTQGAPGRILGDFLESSGIDPQAARGDFEGIVQAGEKRAAPLYKEYYAQNQNVSSPLLDKILDTPAGKKALSDARTKMQNDMSLMGTPDAELMDQAKEGGTLLPAKGAASGMKARVYDYVKRSLDDQIDTAYRSGNKNEGNIVRDLKNRMVGELDKLDVTGQAGPNSIKPEGGAFAQARAEAGDYLGAKDAYEAGGSHILDLKMDPRDVATYFAKLSPTAQAAYKAGIANELLMKAGNLKLAPRLLNTPAVQAKLTAVLGGESAQKFMTGVQQESALAQTGQRMMPGAGSITSDVLNATKEQDMADTVRGASHFARAAGDLASNRYGSAIANALRGIYHFAPDMFKTGGMSEQARNAAGRMLMLPPEEFSQQLQALPAPRPGLGAAALAPYLLGGSK